MSLFGSDFSGAAADHLTHFGEPGLTLLRPGGNVSLALGVVDLTASPAVEMYDSHGHRVALGGTLTIPASHAVDVTTDRLQRGSDVWHIAGEVTRSQTLVTYALTRMRHVALRIINHPGATR